MDNHTAIIHEFTRKCLRIYSEDLSETAIEKLEQDLPEYAETINNGGGYDLDQRIAAQEAALGSCREAFEGLEAELDGLRALIRRVQAMGDRLSDDEIYNRLADVYENGQSPELMQLLTDCQEALK